MMLHPGHKVRPTAKIVVQTKLWLAIIIVDGYQGLCKGIGLPMVEKADRRAVMTAALVVSQGNQLVEFWRLFKPVRRRRRPDGSVLRDSKPEITQPFGRQLIAGLSVSLHSAILGLLRQEKIPIQRSELRHGSGLQQKESVRTKLGRMVAIYLWREFKRLSHHV
jgi:hypothetical protein